MSAHLSQNLSMAVVSNFSSSILSREEASQAAATLGRLSRLDTIEHIQKENQKKTAFNPENRPSLPPANSKNPNYLMILAEAFTKAFDSMANGVVSETRDYASLQNLDQTMAQCVYQSTENAIKKEIQEIAAEKQIEAYEKQSDEESDSLEKAYFYLGIALMAITVASMLFDGGASAAALPEEMEMIEMTSMTADSLSSASGESGSIASNLSDISTDSEQAASQTAENSTTTAENSVENTISNTTENQTQTETNISRTTENNTSRVAQENQKSLSRLARIRKALTVRNVLTFTAKRVFGAGMGAAFGAPTLIRGLSQHAVASKLDELAKLQAILGSALATMQKNNVYFQFYQQLVQRFGNVIQEETSNASEVVETFSDIVSAYRQIPYGLANTV